MKIIHSSVVWCLLLQMCFIATEEHVGKNELLPGSLKITRNCAIKRNMLSSADLHYNTAVLNPSQSHPDVLHPSVTTKNQRFTYHNHITWISITVVFFCLHSSKQGAC